MATADRGERPIDGKEVWVIVLAGGEGKRMRPFVRSWLGEERPKQYCTFTGSRSMLRLTWDRATALTAPQRVVTVVAPHHRRYLDSGDGTAAPGRIVEQPVDRGTAAGLFLPAAMIAAHDPDAVVVVLPADHFVHPEEAFLRVLRRACRTVRRRPDRLLLIGAAADAAETDYGWIVPSLPLAREARPVARFVEKPSPEVARGLLAGGGLWNTMVMAVQVETLWSLGWLLLPRMMIGFEALRRDLARRRQAAPSPAALATLYADLPSADLSRDLVQASPEATLVLPLAGVTWSDWGRPERIVESLAGLGRPLPPPLATAAAVATGATKPAAARRARRLDGPVPASLLA
ncbi:MAG TPA: sugar phosphate nucleotidyltransferase [Thermoanaerobaculia bacterium]|nr:sugar phosphate nucleotidyltransferase [Thermoanaerobaculia bacterium]